MLTIKHSSSLQARLSEGQRRLHATSTFDSLLVPILRLLSSIADSLPASAKIIHFTAMARLSRLPRLPRFDFDLPEIW